MGAAAYNRGSRAISEQITTELAIKKPEMDARFERQSLRDHNDCLRDRVVLLEAELCRAKECIEKLRVYRQADSDGWAARLAVADRRVEILREFVLRGIAQRNRASARIAWLRGLLSFAGVSAEVRDAYERERSN
jgi:hypothetical protein